MAAVDPSCNATNKRPSNRPKRMSDLTTTTRALFHYDAVRRRLWIRGQRCHHGATGALITAISGLAAVRLRPAGILAVTAGVLLMADDWHDRPIWFERGWGTQP